MSDQPAPPSPAAQPTPPPTSPPTPPSSAPAATSPASTTPPATPPDAPPPGRAPEGIRLVEAAGVGIFIALLAIGVWRPWNASTPGVRDDTGIAKLGASATTTPSGLRYEDLIVGTGPSPKAGQTVVVHYRGRLTNGNEFDASRNRGVPFKFVLGQGQVIKGWDEGVASMKIGGTRRLVVPPELGYGSEAAPGGHIPANSTLVFEVELLGVE